MSPLPNTVMDQAFSNNYATISGDRMTKKLTNFFESPFGFIFSENRNFVKVIIGILDFSGERISLIISPMSVWEVPIALISIVFLLHLTVLVLWHDIYDIGLLVTMQSFVICYSNMPLLMLTLIGSGVANPENTEIYETFDQTTLEMRGNEAIYVQLNTATRLPMFP